MDHPPYLPQEIDPDEALAFTINYLDGRPSDEDIRKAALFIGEPLVDWHWAEIADRLLELTNHRRDLRKLISACVFDESVPDEVSDRLYLAADA